MNKLDFATDKEIIYFIDKLLKEYELDNMKYIGLTRIKSHLRAHLLLCKRKRTTPDDIERIMSTHYKYECRNSSYILDSGTNHQPKPTPKPQPTPILDTKQQTILKVISELCTKTDDNMDRIRQGEFNNIIKNKCIDLFNLKTSSIAINKLMIGDLKYDVVKNQGIRYFCNIKQK